MQEIKIKINQKELALFIPVAIASVAIIIMILMLLMMGKIDYKIITIIFGIILAIFTLVITRINEIIFGEKIEIKYMFWKKEVRYEEIVDIGNNSILTLKGSINLREIENKRSVLEIFNKLIEEKIIVKEYLKNELKEKERYDKVFWIFDIVLSSILAYYTKEVQYYEYKMNFLFAIMNFLITKMIYDAIYKYLILPRKKRSNTAMEY